MKLLVSGLLNIETTVAVRGFPIPYYPIDYPFFGVNANVAGVGFNLAKALTTLGDEVSLISYLGQDDEAARILAQLKKERIASDRIQQSLKSTPASAVLFDPDGRRQIYCDLKDIQEQSADPADFEDVLQSCDIAALCNINFNRRLIQAAHRRGVTTATDVHVLGEIDDDYNRDFMANADILFLSDEKLPCSAEEFVRRLHDRYHNKIIAVGMGAQGALLFDAARGETVTVPAYHSGSVVNTIGAGDALFSAFLHFYAKGMDAIAAMQRAVVFAGIKISYNGASVGFCSEEETEKHLP